MKKQLSLFALLMISSLLVCQSDSTIYENLEVVKTYSVKLSHGTGTGMETSYKVNNKEVSKDYYLKFKDNFKTIKECKPCIRLTYDEQDVLLRETISYTDCFVGWYKSYYPNGNLKVKGSFKENDSGDWKDLWNRGYCSVVNGEWMYFSEKGDTLYTEIWDNGEFIKQSPEQDSVELWKVEFTLDGESIGKESVDVNRIGDIKITPKFKNSNKSDLKIVFKYSAIGHKSYEKEFTLDSFKKIKFPKLMKEASIPKDADSSFTINIFCEGVLVKRFYAKPSW